MNAVFRFFDAPTRWILNTSSLETGEILASRVFPLGVTWGNSTRPTSGGHIARSPNYAQVARTPVLPLIQRSLWAEELSHSNGDDARTIIYPPTPYPTVTVPHSPFL